MANVATSEEFIELYPTIPVSWAENIVSQHARAPFHTNTELLAIAENPVDMAEVVCKIDENGEIDSQTLFNWLGY